MLWVPTASLAFRAGADVHPLALGAEQAEHLGRLGPGLANECGTRVSNSATSPAASTMSCSPSSSRSRPDSTYSHS